MAVIDTGAVLRAPEEGRLVRCRGRMWVVTGVDRSSLPPDELGAARVSGQHVVTLSSIEDDARGETAVVVWEAEPGTEVRDSGDLPRVAASGFDPPGVFDAFLDAVRWGAITNVDSQTLQSPFRAGIDIKEYQLAPLARALGMSRVSLLVADDVGLGKTIEAGLIVQELILRHQAETVMVVCPPSLCGKWQREMDERFGLRFEIIDSEMVKRIRRDRGVSTNPFRVHPRMIVSTDWLKAPSQLARLEEILDPDPNAYRRTFDILIVDEAHQCAPAAMGRWAKPSQRTALVRRIAPHFEHRVFLSGTPHNGYSESFQALLELVDPLRYSRLVPPDRRQLHGTTMVRRLKSQLRLDLPPGPDGRPEFPLREVLELPVTHPESELEGLRLVDEYRQALRRGQRTDTSRSAADFLTLLLKKRLLSSPDAFWKTVNAHAETVREQARSGLDQAGLRETYNRVSLDFGDDDDLDQALDEATAAITGASASDSEADEVLRRLQVWAQRHRGRPDAKTSELFKWIETVCDPTGGWNRQRVIVFTEYLDTLSYLRDLMGARGWLVDGRVEFVHGGMDAHARDRIVEEFNYDPDVTNVRVLVATDAASEGIDLHLECWRLLHMEIPFSPTRLEQRNGRVDRYGQPHDPVVVHHFVGRDSKGRPVDDIDFLYRVARKVNDIRDDLGSASPLLSRKIERRLLGEQVSLDDPEIDARRDKANRELYDRDRRLRSELDAIRQRLDTTAAEMGLTPDRVRRVVDAGLAVARQNLLIAAKLTVDPDGRLTDDVWSVPPLSGTWAETVQFLPDPVTEEQRPITFTDTVASKTHKIVYAHLGHPLVARALRLLRAQTWAGNDSAVRRVTARFAPCDTVLVVAHVWVVITGGDGGRLHEELVPAAVRLDGGRPLGVNDTRAAVNSAGDVEPPAHVLDMLADQWPAIEPRMRRALTDRANEVARQRNDALDRRRQTEKQVIRDRLKELETDLRNSLQSPEFQQLRLEFEGLDEARTFQRDVAAMTARLDRIDADIAAEHSNIDRRYAERTMYAFPVAVSFLVPEALR